MLRGFRIALVFLIVVFLKLTVSGQESLSYANCQLTNTCFGRTTNDLSNERSTTPNIIDKETTSNTQTTLTTSQDAAPLATNRPTRVSVNEATSRNSEAPKVTKTSDIVEKTDKYTISSVRKFYPPLCISMMGIKVKELIYLLCYDSDTKTIRTYEDSIPYDLLMVTVTEEIEWTRSMVGIESTNTIYVSEGIAKCIFKIDLDNYKIEKWLSDLDYAFALSVAKDNLVMSISEEPRFLQIYDQDAKLVRSVSLPNDFKGPFHTIQKPNGEFVVSHSLKESFGMYVSFLSIDGQIIGQFRLKETVGFIDAILLKDCNDHRNFNIFATDIFSGNVYRFDVHKPTATWILTDLRVTTIRNSSEERSEQIGNFRSTDGRIFKALETKQHVQLFWDTDNNNLLMAESIFDNIYLFDTNTLKSCQMGRLQNDNLYYDSKKKQFIVSRFESVHIWTLNKNYGNSRGSDDYEAVANSLDSAYENDA